MVSAPAQESFFYIREIKEQMQKNLLVNKTMPLFI